MIDGVVSAVRKSSRITSPRAEVPVPLTSARSGVASALFGASARDDRSALVGSMASDGTLFPIVDALAESTSAVEWELWRPAPSGLDEDRMAVPGHAALDTWHRPNDHMVGQELRESVQQHFELVGEGWMVVYRRAGLVQELWPVRPDRMAPVQHPRKFIAGYVYNGPDGEKVPLNVNEVLRIRRPNPDDPYRGIGAVQAVLADVDSSRYSAEWNRNFFLNSAEPGGIIEIPPGTRLEDDEFEDLRRRWRAQHQGVSQAHRVAILEHGKWVDRKYTQRDMQFAELRNVGSEIIRRAFRFPKPILGTADDVNRAVAEAMDTIYSRWLLIPRLNRWKSLLNQQYLPMFPTGAAGGLEFDYVSPVPADREADREDLTAQAAAAKALVEAGFAPAEVCEAVGLPIMATVERVADETLVNMINSAVRVGMLDTAETLALASTGRREVIDVPAATPRPLSAAGEVPAGLADLEAIQAEWQAAVDDLVRVWQASILPEQYDQIEREVREAVEAGNLPALATLVVSSGAATEALTEAMIDLAEISSRRVVAEAVAQGVQEIEPPAADPGTLGAQAGLVAAILAAGLALSAAGEALRLALPGVRGDEVAAGVRAHLESLTDAQPRDRIGGAMSIAQGAGRAAAMITLPAATYWATEELDGNTCKPCDKIHARQWSRWENAQAEYPTGGYRLCEGGLRCRGQLVARWDVS